eukprot:PhM_4_TR15967/c3_g1_i2/m.45726
MGCGGSKAEPAKGAKISLPQNDPDKKGRQSGIQQRKGEYQWTYAGDVIPPYPPNIPKGEITDETSKRKEAITFDAQGLKASLGTARAIDDFLDNFRNEDPFKDYADIFMISDSTPFKWGSAKIPAMQHVWKTDESFASQRLNGMNPTLVRRLKEVPANLTDDAVKGVLPEGETIGSLHKAGSLYVCNFDDLLKVVGNPPERCLQKP